MKRCSEKICGERFHDGCRSFADTFVPEMVYVPGKHKNGFRKRKDHDPKPRPSTPLLDAFSTLSSEENTHMNNKIITKDDIDREGETEVTANCGNEGSNDENERGVKSEHDVCD